MLRLNKLTDYSTVIMSHMARKPGNVHSVAEMVATLGVAAPTASKILKTLARRDLVHSLRGAKGGYMLSRPPEQISIIELIDAMEAPFGVTECSVAPGLCAQEIGCPIRGNWQHLNQVIRHTLEQVTLADMNLSPIAARQGGATPSRRAPVAPDDITEQMTRR